MSDDDSPTRPPSDGTADILHSDPQQMRQMRRWAVAAIAMVVFVWALFRYWDRHANAYDLLHRMYDLSYLAGLGLLAVAWYAVRYAQRIYASGQYPPPGGWVLGETRVLRDGAARARGHQVIACAVALAVLGLYALYLPHSINAALLRTTPIQMEPPAGNAHG